MNDWIAKKIVTGLKLEKDTVTTIKISFYLATVLAEMEKLFIIVIFFTTLCSFKDIATILIVILMVRPYIGGTHQDTFFKCLTVTILFCAVPIILARYIVVSYFIQILSTVILFEIVCRLGPITSKYRLEYERELLRKMRQKGTVALVMINVFYFVIEDVVKREVTLTLCMLIIDWMIARIEKIIVIKKGVAK